MLPDFFFFCSRFPVQQTTSGVGHRVKYSVFRVGNQYAECEIIFLSRSSVVVYFTLYKSIGVLRPVYPCSVNREPDWPPCFR